MKRSRIVRTSSLVLLVALVWGRTATQALAGEPHTWPSLNLGGTVVSNAQVVTTTPTHVTIKYQGGISRVRRLELPPELKALYPFDPVEAAEYEHQLAQERQRRQAEQRVQQQQYDAAARANLLRQARQAQQVVEQIEKELHQLERELGPLRERARGKPRSPARLELDTALAHQHDLIQRHGAAKERLAAIRKTMDNSP